MGFFNPQNPGLGGLDELTSAEEEFVSNLAGLPYVDGDILYENSNLTNLAIGNTNDILTVTAGFPAWTDTPTLDSIQFDLTPTDATVAEGKLVWNTDDGTLNLGMTGGIVNLQIGQEMLIKSKNSSGGDMTNGQLVYISGASGSKPKITLAKADTEITSKATIGMLTEDIDDGQQGYINTFGLVRGVNTDPGTYTAGETLYLSAGTAGAYTNVKPVSPNHAVCIGYVLNAHASDGIIFLRVNNGLEYYELHDIDDSLSSPTDKALTAWNNTNLLWEQTPQLFYDFANDRLGINNSSPTERLDILGSFLVTNNEAADDSVEDPSQITTGSPNTKGLIIKGTDFMTVEWDFKKSIVVQSSKVDADLTNFPVYVDLSGLGSDFFSNVKADGSDIRITTSDGETEQAREIVSIDTGAETGELHFKAGSLSSSGNTTFYIHYGNSGASEPASDATYGSEAVWSDYDIVYHLQGDPSATATDSAGNYDGTPGAGMTAGDSVAGQIGNAYDFDGGSTDIVSTVNNVYTNAKLNNGLTMSCWFKGIDGSQRLLLDIEGYFFIETLSGNLRGSTDGAAQVRSIPTITDDNWHLAHLVHTSNGGTSTLYGDAETPSSGSTGTPNVDGVSRPVRLGGHSGSTSFRYIGQMDEVRLRNSVLTATWISTEYNNQSDASTFYSVGSQESGTLGSSTTQIASAIELHDADGNINTKFQPGIADGATSIPYILDTDNALVTAGAKILSLKNNGTEQFYVDKDGAVVINEQGADADSRIEGDTDANLVYVDAGNDRVGIGTATPGQKLEVNGITLFDDAIYFTQTDGNEKIDSAASGYLDYTVTTAHRFNMSAINTDVRLEFLGTTNSGALDWMEDEDYFKFDDDILLNTTEKLLFRDTALGIYSQADTFLDLFADGAVRIGDSSAGAPTNYANFAPDGELSLVGTARVKKEDAIFATSTIKGAGAPADVTIQVGTTGTMLESVESFSKTTQNENYFTYHVPEDNDDSVNLEFHLMWKPGAAWTAGNYMWKLEFIVKSDSDDSTTVASTTISADVTPANATDFIETQFATTIDANAQQTISCHFYRDVANDNGDDVGLVRFFEFERTCNKLGETT